MKKTKNFYTGANYTEDLKARLKKAGISHGALARAAGINRTQLSRWFNTPMQPYQRNIAKLEHALELLIKKGVTSK